MRETLIARFEVAGSVRFLSHQEMMRLWHRALVRAAVPMCFSEGFNPHPRISLPLPRSVGVEAKDEIAGVYIERPDDKPLDMDCLRRAIAEQLPQGCMLSNLECYCGKKNFRPQEAEYFLPLLPSDRLKKTVCLLNERLAADERITVSRKIDRQGSEKTIDITEYIRAIEIKNNGVSIQCRITPAGSVRIDEIMAILQIDASMLAGAVVRTAVQWL